MGKGGEAVKRLAGPWFGPAAGVLLLAAYVGAAQAAVPDSLFVEGVELRASARVAGMGGAFVGLADDGAALFYNPAGLAGLRGLELHGVKIEGPELAGAPGFASSHRTVLLAAARGVGIGAMRMEIPPESSEQSEWEGLKGAVGLAIPLGPLAVGVTGNYLVDKAGPLGDERGSGWLADAGALIELGPLRLGAVLRGVAGEFRTSRRGGPESLDLAYYRQTVYGAALRLGFATLALDYALPAGWWGQGTAPHLRAGVEMRLGPVSLRAGVSRHRPEGLQLYPEMHTLGASLSLGPLRADLAVAEPWREGDPPWGAGAAERVQSLSIRLAF